MSGFKTAFSFSNLRHGWVDTHLSVGANNISLCASYTPNDALGDFLQVLLAILPHPGSVAHCCWQREPGWYYWTFTQSEPLIDITIYRSNINPDTVEREMPNAAIFAATCGLDKFAEKVQLAYRTLLTEYGEVAYQELWHHPFPATAYAELQAIIRRRKQQRRW